LRGRRRWTRDGRAGFVGHPRERALVFAAEMCTLTFLRDDYSKSNLVATALFADGAAVALISGDETGDAGLRDCGHALDVVPGSLDVMGWSVVVARIAGGVRSAYSRHHSVTRGV
jgi:predicted naringenin-chalcone synthase